MKEITPRSITTQEAEVLDLALRRGAMVPVPDSVLADLPSLKVVGICTCGCRSIYFEDFVDHFSTGELAVPDSIGRPSE